VPTYIISDVNTLPSFALNRARARSNVKKNLTHALEKAISSLCFQNPFVPY
jgi:hypothetical protein